MPVVESIDRAAMGGVAVTVPTTTETVILTSPEVQTPKQVSFVLIICSVNFTSGTGTTAVTYNIRRGSTVAGAVVGNPHTITETAGQSTLRTIIATEERDSTDFVQYSLSIAQTGASGNGTANDATIIVLSI